MGCRLRIGLTGGIGSGKSEAARCFSRLGVPVIDTDLVARELVQPGEPALAEIVAAFGPGILDHSGALDRGRLRKQVFADSRQRQKLEQILHPRIRERALQQAQRTDAPYCVLVIPLLLESGGDYRLDRILLIDAPTELQRRRAARRDGLSPREIDAVITAQASRAQRLAAADDVIVNDGRLEDLCHEVERLHHRYLELARALRPE